MSPVPISEGYVRSEGRRTFFRVVGNLPKTAAGATPLLAVHGRPPSHEALEPLERLAETGRSVVLYDQQGCGRSDARDGAAVATIDEFADELGAVQAALDLPWIHLLGHSWGGVVAMAYALRQPPGIASLILASTYVSRAAVDAEGERLVDELPADVSETLRRHEAAGTTEHPDYVQADRVFFTRHVCRVDPLPDCLARARKQPATGHVDTESWDIRARLGQIRVPTLVTCGRHDFCTPAQAELIHSGVPGSELVVFEESSHYAHLEETDRYLAVVGEFMTRVEPGSIAPG